MLKKTDHLTVHVPQAHLTLNIFLSSPPTPSIGTLRSKDGGCLGWWAEV